MTEQEASRILPGDMVAYRGRRCQVLSVKVHGIAAPYFRLTRTDDVGRPVILGELISYRLVSARYR